MDATLGAPDETGTTPLILAAALAPEKDPKVSVVEALLKHKANPVLTDNRGYSVSTTRLIFKKGQVPRLQAAAQQEHHDTG